MPPVPDSDLRPFVHVTVPNARVYRQIMGAFVRAKQRFTVHLRPEDIAETVDDPDLAAITEGLTRLVEWGNLRADPDTSRVTTVEDFHRARFLYQLTHAGEAAEEALARYDEALGRRGALQAIALADIATQLGALLELAQHEDPDPAKVHLLLRALVDRFTDLAGNAKAFMGSLQRTIDLHDAELDAFLAYKDRLIDYLERFIKDLVSTGSEIARLVDAVERADVNRLLDLAARREAEDAAPGVGDGLGTGAGGGTGDGTGSADGADGPGEADDPREQEFRRGRVRWQERWAGVRSWFLSTPSHPSQAKLLRAQARASIPALLQIVGSLNERRAGRSDRSADFRRLAVWFAQAPDEAALHRLWRSAFGLSGTRHLMAGPDSVDPDSLDHLVPASTPWSEAPPVRISPQLRRTGSYERRGKPNRVIDRSAQRRYLAELAARESEQTAAARAALATTHPTRLSDLGHLDADAFRLFLSLLGDALATRVPGGDTVETTTSDGSLAVRLTALPTGRAEIRSTHGVFRGPDHVIEISDLTEAPAIGRSA